MYKEAGRYASQQDDLHLGRQADVQTGMQIPRQTSNVQGERRSGRQADTNKKSKIGVQVKAALALVSSVKGIR